MKYYLCGPIDHLDHDAIHGWRNHAKQVLGAENCLDPSDREWDHSKIWSIYKDLVESDLHDLSKCDVVLANIISKSSGSAMEIILGCAQNKLILTCSPRKILSPFVIYFSDYVFDNLDVLLHTAKNLPTTSMKELKRIFRTMKNVKSNES